MRLDQIDWELMWKEAQEQGPPHLPDERAEEERWDHMAPQFRRWMDVDDYPVKLMRNIRLKKEWSVLDIGCVTGAVAIPAAKKAKCVTAIDISGGMLRILKRDAKSQALSNIKCIHRSWESIVVGQDIQPHDVVVASRSVGRTRDLQDALEKIDSAASKCVYITVWGGGERGHNKGVRTALGKPYRDTPDYIYIFNMLVRMGISPNIIQLACRSRMIYAVLDEAIESCKLGIGVMTPQEELLARDYLDRTLIRHKNGSREVPDNRPIWSLIWWNK